MVHRPEIWSGIWTEARAKLLTARPRRFKDFAVREEFGAISFHGSVALDGSDNAIHMS